MKVNKLKEPEEEDTVLVDVGSPEVGSKEEGELQE